MKTILSEAGDTLLKSWPGMFDLYQNPDGAYRAELGNKTAPREVRLRWKIDAVEWELAKALILLSGEMPTISYDIPAPKSLIPFGGSNIIEVHAAAQKVKANANMLSMFIIDPLRTSLADEVKRLADPVSTQAQRTKAKRTLQQRFIKALDAIEKKGDRKAHGNTAAIECHFENGKTRKMPLAWAAIQIARELVESTQNLPTKGEVQRRLESLFPDSKGLSEAKWRQAWKDAALDSLPHDEAWTLPRARQRKSTRTKTTSK
jgi:hypothetical protein